MNKKKIMEELLEENRQINRNIVHLGNLTGLLILMEGMKEAKRERNKGVLTLLKPALFSARLQRSSGRKGQREKKRNFNGFINIFYYWKCLSLDSKSLKLLSLWTGQI